MQYWECNEERPRGTRSFPVEFHHIDRRHPRYAMPYHWHMEWELLRVLQGEFHLTLDEREFTIKAGEYALIGGGVLHGGVPLSCVYECIVFDLHSLMQGQTVCREHLDRFLSRELQPKEYFPQEEAPFSPVLNSFFNSIQEARPGYELTALGMLYQFFGLLIEQGAVTPGTAQTGTQERHILQLKQALEVIESRFDTNLTLEEISRAAGMSCKYFCRFFRAMTHHTPMEYLSYYRLERASFLLTSTDLPVTQIALDCGFNDLSYFIRSFKKHRGISPKKYRAGNQNVPSKEEKTVV